MATIPYHLTSISQLSMEREEHSSGRQGGQPSYKSVQDFVAQTRSLLKQEEQSERAAFDAMTGHKTMAEIEAEGYGLGNMTVVSSKRGYYGKTVLTLTKTYHSDKNPQLIPDECKLQVGDDVALFRNSAVVTDGVVSKRAGPKLQVTVRGEIDEENDLEGLNCSIVLKWNEVTFRRYGKCLEDMLQSDSRLLADFFPDHVTPARHSNTAKLDAIEYTNAKLNEEQATAVKHCLTDRIHLLHGPPGTGKTTTVCQLILEAVARKEKVLACGPSNISVDNIVEGLGSKVNCIRIGNPARMIESVLQRCLDVQVSRCGGLWKGEVKRLQAVKKKFSRASRQEKRQLAREIRQIRDEVHQLQEQTIEEILRDTEVVCCTNTGAADRVFRRYLPRRTFELVVIDECGQSLEVACWIPMLRGRRVVLAGDHKQLPPTVHSRGDSLLSHTLFTRAMEELRDIPSTMLKTQYRMSRSIMGWSNSQFYGEQLRAHPSVADHTLRDLYQAVQPEEGSLLFVDTAGCGMGEEGEASESKFNVGEADLAVAIYRKLLACNVSAQHVAILTPYSKQAALVKSLLGKAELIAPDVSTVDGIQGREKECILISLVRSNAKGEIGFLRDWRRMNVAVTRARRMLVIVGNAETVSCDKHIGSLVKYIEEKGNISSAEEFRQDPNVRFGQGVSDRREYQDKKEGQGDKAAEKEKAPRKNKKKKPKEEQEKVPEHSEEDQEAVKTHYRKVLSQILREIQINNATPFERKMIHEVAEEMGFAHETSKDKKYIKVWRKLTDDEVTEKYAAMERLKEEEDIAEARRKERERRKKERRKQRKLQGKQSTGNNPQSLTQGIKALIDESESDENEEKPGPKEEEEEKQPEVAGQQAKLSKKQRKKQREKEKEERREEEEDNIEEIMKEYMSEMPRDDQCYQCKRRLTSVTAAECKFCRVSFCRSHVLAEEHGCGEAAKEDARRPRTFDKQLERATEQMKERIRKQEEARRKGHKKKGKER